MNYFIGGTIFSQIDEQDQIFLSDFCQIQDLSSGEVLFRQWDEPQAIYIVLSWELAVQKWLWIESKKVADIQEGDIVGEMAFFGDEKRRNATIVAKQDTKLIVIINYALQQILEKNPRLYNELEQIIEKRKG